MISNGLMDTLQIVVLVLVAAGALVVVRTRDRVRLVLVLSVYGILLAVLFWRFNLGARAQERNLLSRQIITHLFSPSLRLCDSVVRFPTVQRLPAAASSSTPSPPLPAIRA